MVNTGSAGVGIVIVGVCGAGDGGMAGCTGVLDTACSDDPPPKTCVGSKRASARSGSAIMHSMTPEKTSIAACAWGL